jgi:energy-coupling factor transporter ATP-binding protein EcfA2
MKYNQISKWQRELECFVNIKNTFILEGNITDIYPVYNKNGDDVTVTNFVNLNTYLDKFLNKIPNSYDVIYYDTVIGFFNPFNSNHIKDILDEYGDRKDYYTVKKENDGSLTFACEPIDAARVIKNAVTDNQIARKPEKKKPIAFVINHASRLTLNPGHLDNCETNIFMNLYYASINGNEILMEGAVRKKNFIFVLANKINDLPAWYYLGNPNVKVLSISEPDRLVRDSFAKLRFPELKSDTKEAKEKLKKFIDGTEGLSCEELKKIKILHSKNNSNGDFKYSDAIFLYKYGIKDSPWESLNNGELLNAQERVEMRVKGQPVAVNKTLDVVKRAISGFSGLQHSSSSRPKGVLFFAGPTGTGKTEMAKTLAELLFGDENACIRFDMSEFQQPQSDQKLLGAPPGYVGYESGGQLTNAVREKPFSLLLFDEIEKAHPSILDKFLQILDDGRMTDGQGNTIYFSETLIVFTSNLGIYKTVVENFEEKKVQVVSSKDSYEVIEQRVQDEIKDYFTTKLGRPEILNRIGNNVVVFDFIREGAVKAIVSKQLNNIIRNIFETKKIVIKADAVVDYLINRAKGNLDNGGRGIGNVVEQYFLNPLGRYCFDNQIQEGKTVIIKRIYGDVTIKMDCEVI